MISNNEKLSVLTKQLDGSGLDSTIASMAKPLNIKYKELKKIIQLGVEVAVKINTAETPNKTKDNK